MFNIQSCKFQRINYVYTIQYTREANIGGIWGQVRLRDIIHSLIGDNNPYKREFVNELVDVSIGLDGLISKFFYCGIEY